MAEVVGRERELDELRRFLDAAPPHADSRVAIIEGEPGIGKTTLWRSAVDDARARGHVVLSCDAAGSETQLAFTGLRDLLEETYDTVSGELTEPQSRALAVMLLREAPPDRPVDPGAIAVAFRETLRRLAVRAPVLLAIDDAQWLDAASATTVGYALRRLRDEPVRVVVARRASTHDPLGLARLSRDRVAEIPVAGLSVGAIGRVLRERLDRTFARPTVVRLHEVSGGNAFYALEIARALPESRSPATLPMPPSLRQLVGDRLGALPPETVFGLELLAASGRATVALVGAALADDPRASLEPAVASGVVEIDGEEVRFAHPLFAAEVYERAALRRKDLHARLAVVVEDPEQRARHLALANTKPAADVADPVAHGAQLAFARGSPAAAAELAEAAVRLTPAGDRAASRLRTLAAADFHFAAGDTHRASTLLDELLPTVPSGSVRARVLGKLGRLRHFERDIGGSIALLYAARDEADDETRGEIEEGLAWGLLLSRGDLEAAAGHARAAVELAERRADRSARAEALAVQAVADFVLGRPWQETMERALAAEDATLHLRVLRHPSFARGYISSCADDLDAARTVFEQLQARAEDAGDEGSIPSLLNHLTLIECLAGRWELAERLAEECFARTLESGQRPTQRSVLGKAALLAARRGLVEEAETKAHEALGDDFDPRDTRNVMERGGETAAWALAAASLYLGRPDDAHRVLGPLTAALISAGVREPGELRFLPDEIEALVLLGELDGAAALLDHLHSWSERVRRPSVWAAAGRCAGLLASARGDGATAIARLEHAVDAAALAPLPFERGRTLLVLGVELRRARRRREARETLQDALATFDQLGARRHAQAARDELARIGGRAPAGDGLTPSELRIASLVAEGKTNREVAAALVVAERTVESALTSVYRKLEVRSRTELARKLADGG